MMTVKKERFYREYKKAMQDLGFYPVPGTKYVYWMDGDELNRMHYSWASSIAGLKIMGIAATIKEAMDFINLSKKEMEGPFHFTDPEMKTDRKADLHAKECFLRFRREGERVA